MPLDLDRPLRFERLGLMLDISRNRVPTLATLERLIPILGQLGYNELQLYTEHSFAYRQHEAVWRHASPITEQEVQHIQACCAQHGIDLVPNQNSFGHMERWLQHTAYQHLAESPDGYEHPISGWKESGSTLYPDAASAQFVDTLYEELFPLFNSKHCHIGGDEPWELGQGRSRERVAQEGKHAVYLDFLQQLLAQAIARGKRPQFWADIVMEKPELVDHLPQGITPVIWGYEADSPFQKQCARVAQAGFSGSYYVAPGVGNWNSFAYRHATAQANIANAAQAGAEHGAQGLLLTAWGDNGHHQAWPTMYPGILMAAAAARGQSLNEAELAETIDHFFYAELAPGNGRALLTLGQIDSQLPQPSPPNSWINNAYFLPETALDSILHLTDRASIEQALEALNHIHPAPLEQQIQLSIELQRAGLERALGLAPTLKNEPLKERFSQAWLATSRSGGLDASLQRMRV